MASVKFIKKTPAGNLGNFNYEYECTCSNGVKHIITVTSGNDNQAKLLAEMECNEKCGEKSKKKIEDLLKELEEAGASVIDTADNETQSIENLKKNSDLARSIADSLGEDPKSFGAWISWGKSIF